LYFDYGGVRIFGIFAREAQITVKNGHANIFQIAGTSNAAAMMKQDAKLPVNYGDARRNRRPRDAGANRP